MIKEVMKMKKEIETKPVNEFVFNTLPTIYVKKTKNTLEGGVEVELSVSGESTPITYQYFTQVKKDLGI